MNATAPGTLIFTPSLVWWRMLGRYETSNKIYKILLPAKQSYYLFGKYLYNYVGLCGHFKRQNRSLVNSYAVVYYNQLLLVVFLSQRT